MHSESTYNKYKEKGDGTKELLVPWFICLKQRIQPNRCDLACAVHRNTK